MAGEGTHVNSIFGMKKIPWTNIALVIFTLFIFFTTLEITQRIRHPNVGFRNMCNSIGFRSPEFNPKKQPGTVRVLFIGSSTTFGTNAPVETTFPFLVGKILREKLPEIQTEAINAAQPCKTSYWELQRIKETLPLGPDVIVVMTGYNDSASIYRNFVKINERGDLIVTPSWINRLDTWIAKHSVFYVTLREKTAIWRYGNPLFAFSKPPNPEKELGLDKSDWFKYYPDHFRNNLEKMAELCADNGVRLIFIKAPLSPQRREEHPLYGEAYSRLMEELSAICRNKEIPLIDLSRLYENSRWRELVSADGLHLTDAGNLKIAEAVAGFLMKHQEDYF